MPNFRYIVFLFFGLAIVFHYWPRHVVPREGGDEDIPPSVAVGGDIAADPTQAAVHLALAWKRRGYVITPLAEYGGTVRVLNTESYSFGREAELSPEDLVFGWGPMSDPNVIAKISISQGERWYHWQASDPPIPLRDIETHSANTHIIPADDLVAHELATIEAGDTIDFNGYLVEVRAPDGWDWKSSLTRDDVGEGACELLWLENLYIHHSN